MKKLYAVVKYAIYRHEINGVSTSLERACKIAQQAKKAETDDHHDFCILSFKEWEYVEDGKLAWCDNPKNPPHLYI